MSVDTEKYNPDEGLENDLDSESLSDAYDALDSLEDVLTDSDKETANDILKAASEGYDDNSEEWDKLLKDLKDTLEHADLGVDEDDEEIMETPTGMTQKLQALRKRANTIESK